MSLRLEPLFHDVHSQLSPEMQSLLYSGHIQTNDALEPDAKLQLNTILENNINCNRLIEMALYHKMAPLLCQALIQASGAWAPASVLDQLRDASAHLAMRNMTLTQELLRLLELLKTHNIDALAFKGPALTSLLYDNLILRQFGDLDILVHPQNILSARELLLANGYRIPETAAHQASEAEMLQDGHALHVEHATSYALVDLHWRLGGAVSPLPLTFEHLWQHHQSMTLLGTPVNTFQTEDLLIYLCAHGAKHFWYKLGWICDVAALVRRQPDLLNDAFMARAKACGAERMVLLGLLVARRYFDAPLPEAIWLRAKADATIPFLMDVIHQRLFIPSPEVHSSTGSRLYRRYLQLRMRERFRDQLSMLLAIAATIVRPTRQDRDVLHLPPWASCLYYLIRPIHLLKRYGLRLLKEG